METVRPTRLGRRIAKRLPAAILLIAALPSPALADVYQVNTTTDVNPPLACSPAPGDCSLREAVLQANGSNGNTISIPAGVYKLTLTGAGEEVATTGDLDVISSTAIVGVGAGQTIIDGNGTDRVFDFKSPASTLAGVTVANGMNFANGGGIYHQTGTLAIADSVISGNAIPNALSGGGGIYVASSAGSLNIDRTTISGNSVMDGEGGGIYNTSNTGITTITNSTISGNSTKDPTDGGGGIYNESTLLLTNSTISGNTTPDTGGALDTHSGPGTAVIKSSTIAFNSAGQSGGAVDSNFGQADFQNSIVAGNTSPNGASCRGTSTSLGHNIETDASCAFNGAGDLKNTDPQLQPLTNNGGPTATHALLAGTPAIDAADAAACPAADQRGVPRPQIGGCDVGSFELVPLPLDTTAPVASTLGVDPSKLRPAVSGGSVIARKKKRKKPRGAKVSFQLSEAASVAFTVEKLTKGYKRGKKCKTKRKKRAKRCTIVKLLPGSFTVQGKQGSNSYKFSGRLNNKKLKRGSYKLVATPTDPSRNRGAAVRTAFKIVK